MCSELVHSPSLVDIFFPLLLLLLEHWRHTFGLLRPADTWLTALAYCVQQWCVSPFKEDPAKTFKKAFNGLVWCIKKYQEMAARPKPFQKVLNFYAGCCKTSWNGLTLEPNGEKKPILHIKRRINQMQPIQKQEDVFTSNFQNDNNHTFLCIIKTIEIIEKRRAIKRKLASIKNWRWVAAGGRAKFLFLFSFPSLYCFYCDVCLCVV